MTDNLTPSEVRGIKHAIAIVTPLLEDDYATSARIIWELDRATAYGVILSLISALFATAEDLGQVTGRDPKRYLRDRLQALGAAVAREEQEGQR